MMVLAMMMVGFPFLVVLAFSRAASMALKSCPSMVMVFHPMAVKRPAWSSDYLGYIGYIGYIVYIVYIVYRVYTWVKSAILSRVTSLES